MQDIQRPIPELDIKRRKKPAGETLKNYLKSSAALVIGLATFLLSVKNYESLASFALGAGIFSGIVLFFDFFRLRMKTRIWADTAALLLLFVFMLGLFGSIAAVPTLAWKILLGLTGGALLFFYHRHFPRKLPIFLDEVFTVAAGLFALIFLWSMSAYFLLDWWIQLTLSTIVFFMIFWQNFYKQGGLMSRAALLESLVATLIAAETVWAILFLPVHFLTAAAVNFSIFYLIYILSNLQFSQSLTGKKVYFQVSLIVMILAAVLLTSPWKPIQ